MEDANYFAVIPGSVRYNKELSSNEKLLYTEISALTKKEGFCWASNQYFAEMFGVAKTSISHWISHLSKLGFLKVELTRKENKEIEYRKIFLLDPMVSENHTYSTKLPHPMVCRSKENKININNINLNNISEEVVNTPSSDNDETVENASEAQNTPSQTEAESHSQENTSYPWEDNPKEKEKLPAKEKEKVNAKDVISHYASRWEVMKEHGYVHTNCPKQSFGQIGMLVKSNDISLEDFKTVIDAGFKDTELVREGGYQLKTMLSSWWVNKVLNGQKRRKTYLRTEASVNPTVNANYSETSWG